MLCMEAPTQGQASRATPGSPGGSAPLAARCGSQLAALEKLQRLAGQQGHFAIHAAASLSSYASGTGGVCVGPAATKQAYASVLRACSAVLGAGCVTWFSPVC
jgi:hypothetical protein